MILNRILFFVLLTFQMSVVFSQGSRMEAELFREQIFKKRSVELCEKKWGKDYSMQEHCQKNQFYAIKNIIDLEIETEKMGLKDDAVSKEMHKMFNDISELCSEKWGVDKAMVWHCIEKQTKSYINIKK